MGKTFAAILDSMKLFIKSKSPNLDTSEGTTLNDVVMSAPAREIAQLYTGVDTASDAQSLNTTNSQALDKIAENIGLVRKSGRKSRGVVTFFSNSVPTSDIVIPSGAVVATVTSSSGPTIQFVTTNTFTMYAKQAAVYLSPYTNKYEINVDVEAVQAGTSGNVGASNISTVITVVGGIDGCYNLNSITGGLDEEDDASLRWRIASRWSGTTIGTGDGYSNVVLSQSGVDDAVVVGHGDTGRSDFGSVDIYVKGRVARAQSDSYTSLSAFYPDIVFSKQPILTDSTVTVQSSLTGTIVGTNYSLVKDLGAYGGSISGQDTLHWVVAQSGTGSLYVSYSYNGLIEDLQNLFSKTNKDILDTSILVREAIAIPIDITCNIKVTAGYDSTSVISLLTTEIADLFSGLRIGESIQQTDLVNTFLNTPGVDDLQLPFTVFRSSDFSVLPDSFNNLNIPVRSYASSGTIIINVTI
jgi:uncharacterized phage protein gp47/JayE